MFFLLHVGRMFFLIKKTGVFPSPPEVFEMILLNSKTKDIVSFTQASSVVRNLYYSSLPQLGDFRVRSFHASIQWCGIRRGIEGNGLYCSRCYAWSHATCVGVNNVPLHRQYLCSNCRETRLWPALDPGGVTKASRRKDREVGCGLDVSSVPKLLQLRVSPPAHLRPGIRILGTAGSVRPLLIDYTIRFSDDFSGLAYGLELDSG